MREGSFLPSIHPPTNAHVPSDPIVRKRGGGGPTSLENEENRKEGGEGRRQKAHCMQMMPHGDRFRQTRDEMTQLFNPITSNLVIRPQSHCGGARFEMQEPSRPWGAKCAGFEKTFGRRSMSHSHARTRQNLIRNANVLSLRYDSARSSSGAAWGGERMGGEREKLCG